MRRASPCQPHQAKRTCISCRSRLRKAIASLRGATTATPTASSTSVPRPSESRRSELASIVKDWRIKLIETHPGIFHPPEGHPEQASGYPWCEEGWRDLLERLCGRIESALREGETIRILEIKEKFAGLRCYWRGDVLPETAAQINEAIALAEARSECTCEECGEKGQAYRHDGVYMTRCAAHAKGTLLQAEPGRENVHIVRRVTADGFRIAPRRYDRASDSFVDALPGSPDSKGG
jgi:hypothetical protein